LRLLPVVEHEYCMREERDWVDGMLVCRLPILLHLRVLGEGNCTRDTVDTHLIQSLVFGGGEGGELK